MQQGRKIQSNFLRALVQLFERQCTYASESDGGSDSREGADVGALQEQLDDVEMATRVMM